MTKQIVVTFTQLSEPIDTLTPKITIWDITNAPPSSKVIDAQDMTAIGSGSGGYFYNFASYDSTKNYYILCDGENSQIDCERYAFTTNDNSIREIIEGVWDEPNNLHLIDGSTGKNLSDLAQQLGDEQFFGYGK